MPRLLIGGTGSGCGKTTVTCALLKAFTGRGLHTASCKTGPDYIDPMFHSRVIGAPSANLDLFLCGEKALRFILVHAGQSSTFRRKQKEMEDGGKEVPGNGTKEPPSEKADLTLVEGAMGLYDGRSFTDDAFSANHIARLTETPTLLVVNVRGKSASLLAEIRGYLTYRPNLIRGLIFNHCSKGMYPQYQAAVEQELGLRAYGFLPPMEDVSLESRHLGLVTAAEVENLREKVRLLGQAAEENMDLEGIRALTEAAPLLIYDNPMPGRSEAKPVQIGVAWDKAFCFYYDEVFRFMEEQGAELIPVSPLTDKILPQGLGGLILGGGYPELYAKDLAANASMREEIGRAASSGMPIYAECGGFMYLGKTLTNVGTAYPMAGVLPVHSKMEKHLVNFGYKTMTAQRDNLLCRQGEEVRAHEFHYSSMDNPGDLFSCQGRSGRLSQAGMTKGKVLAAYPHIHFLGQPSLLLRFLEACRTYAGRSENHA